MFISFVLNLLNIKWLEKFPSWFQNYFSVEEILIEEGLEDYQCSLGHEDIDWSLRENEHYQNYGLTLLDKIYEKKLETEEQC
jgi:hypothetical protein